MCMCTMVAVTAVSNFIAHIAHKLCEFLQLWYSQYSFKKKNPNYQAAQLSQKKKDEMY